MSCILVTGGAGYIGSHACKALAADGHVPVTFDNLSTGHADLVQWGPFVRGDILDLESLDEAFRRYHPVAVIHFAGLAYVGESFSEPLRYYKTNAAGIMNLLEIMVRNGVGKIVFSSSCTTYGIPDRLPISEDAPQRPISPYGRSKLMCETILKDVAFTHQLRFAIFRYFNACGADPGGKLTERHDPETHLIPLAIDAAAGKRPALQIFGNDYSTSDGTCERDFIHVSDLASAHVEAIDHLNQDGTSFELNLGSGRPHSVLQIVAAIEQATGKKVPVTWGPRRPGDPPILCADPALARRILRYRPRFSDIETIIETTWRSRTSGIDKP